MGHIEGHPVALQQSANACGNAHIIFNNQNLGTHQPPRISSVSVIMPWVERKPS